LVQIYAEVFRKLNIKVKILINNRKILYGLAEAADITDKFMDMTIAIDKIDKIGNDGMVKEMMDRGITQVQALKVLSLLEINQLHELKMAFTNLPQGSKGIEELETVFGLLEAEVSELTFDISLARGLNYYTGCIFEVKVDTEAYRGFTMGSIGGGGRYDNLTGVFGLDGVSGVGVSFGAERIYDVMEELKLFPSEVQKDIDILFLALDDESHTFAFRQVSSLRKAGIACDLYPEPAKLKKQMAYANARNVPYVGIIGESERLERVISLKNMVTGEQNNVNPDTLIQLLK